MLPTLSSEKQDCHIEGARAILSFLPFPVDAPVPDGASSVSAPWPRLSVIVPVYRDRASLAGCLKSLSEQDYPPDRFEIVIVDNESDARQRLSAEGFRSWGDRVRVVHEARPGSYAARNRGCQSASGDVFAFTDADCVPARDWLRKGVERWRQEADGVIGGAIRLSFRETVPNLFELFDALFLGYPQETFVTVDHYAATANLFCGRAVMTRVGCFDAALVSGGDYEWGRRAHAMGARVVFDPEAIVVHPARSSFSALVTKVRRHSGALWTLSHREPIRSPFLLNLRRETVRAREMIASLGHANGAAGGKRLQLLALILLIQAIRVAELARLSLGGTPVRR